MSQRINIVDYQEGGYDSRIVSDEAGRPEECFEGGDNPEKSKSKSKSKSKWNESKWNGEV